MKKQVLKMFLLTIGIILTLSGCNTNGELDATSIVDFKNDKSYFAFPKTDWGMSPQEVMKAWNLTMDDVTVMPEVRDPNTSLTIRFTVNKSIKVIGEPVTNVAFGFTYLIISGKGVGDLGLTSVTADFDYKCFDKVMSSSKSSFGDKFVATMIYPSKDNFGTLPTEKRDTIIDVFSQYEGYSDFNKNSERLSLSAFEMRQIPDSPSPVRVTYDGYFAAMANNDYSTFYKAMDDFRNKFGISD